MQQLAKICCRICFHLLLTSELTLGCVLKVGSVNSPFTYLSNFASCICFYSAVCFQIIKGALRVYCVIHREMIHSGLLRTW